MEHSTDYNPSIVAPTGELGDWMDSVREEIAAFRREVEESARQLAAAAQKFAVDSAQVLQEVSLNAEASAVRSRQAAETAAAAVAEAKQLAAHLEMATGEAIEQIREEARSAVQGAVGRAEEAAQSSRDLFVRMQEDLESAMRQMEASLNSCRESANEAAGFAERAREAAGETGGSQQATTVDPGEIAALREAVAGAERAAAAAREAALEATTTSRQRPAPEPLVTEGAREILERLETDYSLLTRIVGELRGRVADLTRPATAPGESAHEDPGGLYAEPAYAATDTATAGSPEPAPAPGWPESPGSPGDGWNSARYVEDRAATDTDPLPTGARGTAATRIAGRVLVTISPVPDFDRLLGLDGALGRMNGVANVILVDYAREEVTFRIDFDPEVSLEDFCSRLSDTVGAGVEVVAAGEDSIILRLAS